MSISTRKAALCCGSAAVAIICASTAWAQAKAFDVPSESAVRSIPEFARQAGVQIVAPADQIQGLRTDPIKGTFDIRVGLDKLLRGTGLQVASSDEQTILLRASRKNFLQAPEEAAGSKVTPSLSSETRPQADSVETVTVSSSRIADGGFNAPTPTTVMSANFIEQQAKHNLFNAVTQLPSMMGSSGQAANVNGTGGGVNGTAAFSMFGLGIIRTLTLLDGQRFVPANVQGFPDISAFPQMLIQRVDVVTGGASASWGSDAMAGVVNFITDKKYVGFKSNISSGLSTYKDNATLTAQFAAGTSFAGGRGHFTMAGEYSHSDGVEGGWKQLSCCGGKLEDSLSNGRTWFSQPTLLQYSSPAATPAGEPQYYVRRNGQLNQFGRYGLINSGPLMGIAFGPNGSTYRYNYGVGVNGLKGVPNRNGTAGSPGTVANCINQWCIGGQTDGQSGSGVTITTPITRGNVYSRLSYDITDNVNVWATVSLSKVHTSNIPNPVAWHGSLPGISGAAGQSASLTSDVFSTGTGNPGQLLQSPGIKCGNAAGGANAFLPASINAECVANNITSFGFGSLYYGLGPQKLTTNRETRRFTGGADGKFNAFDTDWTWNAYYEHGETDTHIKVRGITLRPYLFAAIDSVKDSQGVAVCRSTTARAAGCIPFDPFGATPTQAQLDWVYGGPKWGHGPRQVSHYKQDVADFAVSGSPFELWAGKVSVATGATWRQEAYDVTGDGAGQGTTTLGQNGAPGSPCVDPLLNCLNGTNWYAGSFHNGQGNYHVLEGFVEVNVPLMDSPAFGSANLNASGRHAKYSTAGSANTWKVGLTWDTPFDGVRLRALQSRDLRAPNLSELFAAPITTNNTNNDPWRGGSIQAVNVVLGNPALKPEKSINTQLGIVFQPSWLPGFNTSLDYYRIYIGGQIDRPGTQTSVNLCFAGLTQYCSAIEVAGGASPAASANWLTVRNQAFNQASTKTDGFNWEATYQFSLADWGLLPIPGDFTFRTMATYVSNFKVTPGLPGTFPYQLAGINDGAIPHLKAFLTQSYQAENWEFHVSENWVSEGRRAPFSGNYIECKPGTCPAPTLQNPTIDDIHNPGQIYINMGGSINLDDNWKVYGQVDNLLNKSPPPLYVNYQNPLNNGANPQLYDVIGRMFHVGIRTEF